MNTIRIMVVDDAKLNREYVRFCIAKGQTDPSIALEVIKEVENGQDAIQYLEQCEGKERPDVILMDIRFKEGVRPNGLTATKTITARYPTIKVIIWSQYDELEYVKYAFRNRASGYVLKNSEEGIAELCQVIVRVWKGEYCVTQRIFEHMVTLLTADPTILTPREREVAELYAQGKSDKEIAVCLGVTVKAVETHKTNLRDKLKAKSPEEVREKLADIDSTTDQRLFSLTALELEIAKQYAQNQSVEEMADILKMMLTQTLLTEVQKKLGASSSAEVKSRLIEEGLLSSGAME